ncbi:MAG: hypothetical protein IJ083_09730 [Clostridia bacterium]|nr:hypothetical protein [Clostridia bacterium]
MGRRVDRLHEAKRQQSSDFPFSLVVTPFAVLLALFLVWAFTGIWPWKPNPYKSYALQAEAWLHGRLDLGQDYPWLELAIYKGKYYVSFPPFPSFVLLPFAVFMGSSTPDGLISLVVTLVGSMQAVRLCREAGYGEEESIFWSLFLYLGTGYLFIGSTGWVWFFAQSLCFTLLLSSVLEAVRGHGGWSLAFWAMAVGCRPFSIIYLPLLFWILRQWARKVPVRKWILSHLTWAIAPIIIACVYMTLNVLRFDSPVEFGHTYLPEFQRAEKGQFSLSYVPEHLLLLLRLPQVGEKGELVFEHLETMAFYLINPLIFPLLCGWIWALRERRHHLLFLLPLLGLFHVLLLCMHRTLGGFQFGNRYFLDPWPALFWGLLLWRSPGRKSGLLWVPFFVLGAGLNLLGTVLTYSTW